MAIASVFPAVAGDLESPANSSGREYDGFRPEQVKSPAFAVVAKRAADAAAVLQESDHRVLHEDVQAEMNSMVLERANHFQAGAIAHVRQPRVAMTSKIALQDAAILG